MQPMQPLLLANELNPEVILAAQIVLGLFVLIITLLLAFSRIVGLFQQLIRDLHQIILMAHDGFQVVSFLELIFDVVGSLVSQVDKLKRLIHTCRGIWNIWTAQPSANANDGHNNVIVNQQSTI